MLKEIKVIDEKKGIARVTTVDERWYFKTVMNLETGLPETKFFPSSTWIISCYPKGKWLTEWREEVGKEEADRIKKAAGSRGSKVHYACEMIDRGMEIDIQKSKFLNPNNGQEEELTADEVLYILNYKNYIEDKNNILLANELVVFGDVYAGTIDKIWATPTIVPGVRQIWLIDLKTSKSVSREYELQLSSYSHADIDYKKLGITDEEWVGRKLGVLRLDYGKERKAFLNEVEDCYSLFRDSIYPTWQDLYSKSAPKQYEFPLKIASQLRKGQIAEEEARITRLGMESMGLPAEERSFEAATIEIGVERRTPVRLLKAEFKKPKRIKV